MVFSSSAAHLNVDAEGWLQLLLPTHHTCKHSIDAAALMYCKDRS